MATPFLLRDYKFFTGRYCRNFRHRYGIEANEVVAKAGVDRERFRHWETGHWRMRPLGSLPADAVVYGVLLECAIRRCDYLKGKFQEKLKEWNEELERLRQEPLK